MDDIVIVINDSTISSISGAGGAVTLITVFSSSLLSLGLGFFLLLLLLLLMIMLLLLSLLLLALQLFVIVTIMVGREK